MNTLIKSVDEELNLSKKSSMARVKGQKWAGLAPPTPPSPTVSPGPAATRLEMERVRERFREAEVTKVMTIHHQLLAMERSDHAHNHTPFINKTHTP